MDSTQIGGRSCDIMNSTWSLLIFSLAVSIVLHLALFYIVPIGFFVGVSRHAAVLQVRLIVEEIRRTNEQPNTFTKDNTLSATKQTTGSAHSMGIRDVFNTKPVQTNTNKQTSTESKAENALSALPPPAKQVSSDQLLETARKIAREEAKKIPPSLHERTGSDDSPVLPELDRVLTQKSQREISFADGTTRVVTRFGTTYCLKPPPDFARSGIGAQLSVPLLCP